MCLLLQVSGQPQHHLSHVDPQHNHHDKKKAQQRVHSPISWGRVTWGRVTWTRSCCWSMWRVCSLTAWVWWAATTAEYRKAARRVINTAQRSAFCRSWRPSTDPPVSGKPGPWTAVIQNWKQTCQVSLIGRCAVLCQLQWFYSQLLFNGSFPSAQRLCFWFSLATLIDKVAIN